MPGTLQMLNKCYLLLYVTVITMYPALTNNFAFKENKQKWVVAGEASWGGGGKRGVVLG